MERVGLNVVCKAVGVGDMHKVAPVCGGAGEVIPFHTPVETSR